MGHVPKADKRCDVSTTRKNFEKQIEDDVRILSHLANIFLALLYLPAHAVAPSVVLPHKTKRA